MNADLWNFDQAAPFYKVFEFDEDKLRLIDEPLGDILEVLGEPLVTYEEIWLEGEILEKFHSGIKAQLDRQGDDGSHMVQLYQGIFEISGVALTNKAPLVIWT